MAGAGKLLQLVRLQNMRWNRIDNQIAAGQERGKILFPDGADSFFLCRFLFL